MFFHPLQQIEEAAGPLSYKLLQRLHSPALSFTHLPLLPSLGQGSADALGQVLDFFPADANGLARHLAALLVHEYLDQVRVFEEVVRREPKPELYRVWLLIHVRPRDGEAAQRLGDFGFFLSANFFFFFF